MTVPAPGAQEFVARAAAADVPVVRLGETGGEALRIAGVGDLGLDELRTAWEATFPDRFGALSV